MLLVEDVLAPDILAAVGAECAGDRRPVAQGVLGPGRRR